VRFANGLLNWKQKAIDTAIQLLLNRDILLVFKE
jgi:hypothetical protein